MARGTRIFAKDALSRMNICERPEIIEDYRNIYLIKGDKNLLSSGKTYTHWRDWML